MAASSSRARSSSPFGPRKHSYSYSSNSSSTTMAHGKLIPRSCSSTATSHFYGGGRSVTPSRGRTGRMPSETGFAEPLVVEETRSGDSISVTVRFRPLSEREYQKGDEISWYADGDKMVRNEYNPATAYAFDRVFGPSTNSKAVYDVAARPVVKAAMEGINGTVFAYGVTSSGKTHTMHGDQISPGIIPLAIKDVFNIIQDTPGREFLLRVSYLEIYNEIINDLLDPTGQNLRVREDAQGTYVEGIKEEVVLSPGHALSFIAAGEEHRHVGSNNFNLMSSRSHTIFTLMIESSEHGDEYDGVIYSQLNLIDLAGSESSKTETTGLRRKEGSYINKSLLTLGTVIGKLSEGKASHVPYRDSKLTRLLQSSLSGHGHVSLICTITPASSNMEETHNTLKFASRAKRVEIYASRNRIIDEKSLIKKYQKEISSLKEELEQFKKGTIVGVNQEELQILKQQLQEGQVKMQSRLEEEEDAKAALMSRIQRLTKLILVSTKNSMSGGLTDTSSHHRRHSFGEEDKLDVLRESSPLLLDGEVTQKDSPPSTASGASEIGNEFKFKRSSSRRSDDQNLVPEPTQAGEIFSGSATILRASSVTMSTSDQMDLLVEQVKMLAGEVAFNTSNLKRLAEQSVSDPNGVHIQEQIKKLEGEIQEKRRQMRVLEQRITESGEASMANASLVDMQQTLTRLMTQCNEKAFELELRSADNRILQEQLLEKCMENNELQQKIVSLEKQIHSLSEIPPSLKQSPPSTLVDELRNKLKFQEAELEKLKQENMHLADSSASLQVQNQKLSEDATYAMGLASAAAVELKILAGEVTKLSVENAKQAKELHSLQEMSYSRGSSLQPYNGTGRKHLESKIDGNRYGRKGRFSVKGNENSKSARDDFGYWSLDAEDMKSELQYTKQREVALEASLAAKEVSEEELRKKADDAKKREAELENELANMWILVAKLKKDNASIKEQNDKVSSQGAKADTDIKPPVFTRQSFYQGSEFAVDVGPQVPNEQSLSNAAKIEIDVEPQEQNDQANSRGAEIDTGIKSQQTQNAESLKDRYESEELFKPHPDEQNRSVELEALVTRLKSRMLEKVKEKDYALGDEDSNSHVCKVCFEVPTAVMLLPCRHFCLCKPCSLACSECPLCRTKIDDRIIAFT